MSRDLGALGNARFASHKQMRGNLCPQLVLTPSILRVLNVLGRGQIPATNAYEMGSSSRTRFRAGHSQFAPFRFSESSFQLPPCRSPINLHQMKPLERLGQAHTPDGTLLELFRHDGAYLIKAAGVELMSTRRHLSEDRLAEVACAPLAQKTGARVLIGGLGLGFTLRAALKELQADAEVVVAELVQSVIDWNANPEYALSHEAMQDARVRIVHDDVVNVLAANVNGFDAIMLDTDNGPAGMLMSENERLYVARGISLTMNALRSGGIIAYWSVGDDKPFVGALQRAGLRVKTELVRAHASVGPMHSLYIATPRPNEKAVEKQFSQRQRTDKKRRRK